MIVQQSHRLSRRTALKVGAGAAALPLVHIRTAGAAGKLSAIFFDHPVPSETAMVRKLVGQWAEQHKVETTVDFIDAFGDRVLTIAAEESLARTGHDIVPLPQWRVHQYADFLVPVDDVLQSLVARYGAVTPIVDYLAKVDGSYHALPTYLLAQNKPCCSRIDLLKQYTGIDVQSVFPVAEHMGPGYDDWTWDRLVVAAEKCAKAGYPFGLTMSNVADAVDMVGSLFRSFGAQLVDASGAITVDSDTVRAVLDYARRLMGFVPADVYNWDNASNNKALIANKTALIFNPPSAWATAVRDAPAVGAQCWTHPPPSGPAGRFVPYLPQFWGIWTFAKNASAAKALLGWLSEREQAAQIITAGHGFDLPPFMSMTGLSVWAEEGPPKGTLFNYPTLPQHHAEPSLAGWPAPPAVGTQIYTQGTMPGMIAKAVQSGLSNAQVIAWAKGELEGFMR